MSTECDQSTRPDRRRVGTCQECAQHRRLNPIWASHAGDIAYWLCDECRDKRQQALDGMYRGE